MKHLRTEDPLIEDYHNIRVRHLNVILIIIIYVNEDIISLVSSQQTGCMTTSYGPPGGHMLGILYFYLDTSSTSSSPTLVETWDSPVISHIR